MTQVRISSTSLKARADDAGGTHLVARAADAEAHWQRDKRQADGFRAGTGIPNPLIEADLRRCDR